MDFLKNRYTFLAISWVLFFVSIYLLLVPKLNLWIDMTWGIQMEYDYVNTEINYDTIREKLDTEKQSFLYEWNQAINNINVYKVTWENILTVVVWFYSIDNEIKLDELKNTFKSKVYDVLKTIDPEIKESKYINIWKSFGDYIKNTAFITLALAIIAITIYVTFAFSWVISWISVFSFAVITVITLFHDIIISSWLYIFTSMYYPEFQIDTFFITALLTILGYSINDTIVVFDRIRDNLKKYAGKKTKNNKELKSFDEIINMSINDTLTRSIYTSLTLFFVLLTIILFWPESIKWFILVMMFGTIIGTYSSIFIAAPILYEVNKNKKLSVYKKIEVNPDDKIVV